MSCGVCARCCARVFVKCVRNGVGAEARRAPLPFRAFSCYLFLYLDSSTSVGPVSRLHRQLSQPCCSAAPWAPTELYRYTWSILPFVLTPLTGCNNCACDESNGKKNENPINASGAPVTNRSVDPARRCRKPRQTVRIVGIPTVVRTSDSTQSPKPRVEQAPRAGTKFKAAPAPLPHTSSPTPLSTLPTSPRRARVGQRAAACAHSSGTL